MRILPNRNEVGVFLRNPRTLESNFRTLGEASEDSIVVNSLKISTKQTHENCPNPV